MPQLDVFGAPLAPAVGVGCVVVLAAILNLAFAPASAGVRHGAWLAVVVGAASMAPAAVVAQAIKDAFERVEDVRALVEGAGAQLEACFAADGRPPNVSRAIVDFAELAGDIRGNDAEGGLVAAANPALYGAAGVVVAGWVAHACVREWHGVGVASRCGFGAMMALSALLASAFTYAASSTTHGCAYVRDEVESSDAFAGVLRGEGEDNFIAQAIEAVGTECTTFTRDYPPGVLAPSYDAALHALCTSALHGLVALASCVAFAAVAMAQLDVWWAACGAAVDPAGASAEPLINESLL